MSKRRGLYQAHFCRIGWVIGFVEGGRAGVVWNTVA
jgi:hypothetical protein